MLRSAREVSAEHTLPQLLETEWVLDVRGLSPRGAKVAFIEWSSLESEPSESKPTDDVKMVLITSENYQLNVVQDNRVFLGAYWLLTELFQGRGC